MDPHIIPDPDPDQGSQNLADLTDPDFKHWEIGKSKFLIDPQNISRNSGYRDQGIGIMSFLHNRFQFR